MSVFVHPTAVVDPGAELGDGTRVWHFSHVMARARLGRKCVVGQNVYLGNVNLEEGTDSFCPHCHALLVHRMGYNTMIKKLEGDQCGECGKKLNFVV